MKCLPLAFFFSIGVTRTSSGSLFSLTSCDKEDDDSADGALAVVAPDADADVSPFFEVVLDVDADVSPCFFFATEVSLEVDAFDESPFFFDCRFGFFPLSFLLLSPSA